MFTLVLRHEIFEGLGNFGETLTRENVTYNYRDLGALDAVPRHDALIIMGGPMGANDALPGLADELRIIERAVENGIPVLGICLGSQLIAKVLGARVYRNAELEVGWAPVHLTEAGKLDPVFAGIDSPTTFFHWHGDTFDLPEGAQWLAFSEKCRHQAYRWRGNVYGLQFHPEVSAAMIADWSAQPVNCADVATLAEPIDPQAFDQRESADRILRAWLRIARVGQSSAAHRVS